MAEHTKLNFDWSKAVCWPTGETPQLVKNDGYTPTVGMLKRAEELPVDQLGRSDTARFLTGLANHKKNGYVLNLNCPWGTGKTWFLKRWYLTLKTQHPVVYIDAWKYDHNDSPLLIILKQIINELEKQSPQAAKGFAEQIKSSQLFATLKVLGPEFIKVALRIDTEQLMEKAAFAFEKSHIDDLASKATTLLLDNIDKETQAVEELKEAIATLLDDIVGSTVKPKLTYPLFIFVDELDRCRPTFAIEMLEAIKHVFGIPQIFFVIATDSEQLQHSVNAVYGEKFGSYNYLKRFFDASFQLETPTLQNYISTQSELDTVFTYYESEHLDIFEKQSKEDFCSFISELAHSLSFDLRTTKQWLSRLDLVVRLSSSKLSQIPFIALLALSAIKEKNSFVYTNLPRATYGSTTATEGLMPLFIDNSKALEVKLTLKSVVFAKYSSPNLDIKKTVQHKFIEVVSDLYMAVSSKNSYGSARNNRTLIIQEYRETYGHHGDTLNNINSLLELSGQLRINN